MVLHSRRSVLQATAVGLGVFSAGCNSTTETEDPVNNTSNPSPDDSSQQPSNGDDEEEDQQTMQPPGSPPLDASGAWPSYRYDVGNTGANPEGVGVKDGTSYWRLDAGGPATFANDTLYNTNHDAITYRDPATAAVDTHTDLAQYGLSTVPTVGKEYVFVNADVPLSFLSETLCFDIVTGELLWSGPELKGVVGAPSVHDGTVIINPSSYNTDQPHLRAFAAATGEELWQYNLEHTSHSTPAIGDNRVFVSSEGGLHAVEIESGEEAYTVTGKMNSKHTPVVDDGTVYVGNSDRELVAADARDGTVRWRSPVPSTSSPPVVTEEVVYSAVADGIAALDSRDGSVISSNSLMARPLGLVGDVLYAAAEGALRAFDTQNELRELWSLGTENISVEDDWSPARVNSITPVDGAVYVSGRDGFYGVGPQQ